MIIALLIIGLILLGWMYVYIDYKNSPAKKIHALDMNDINELKKWISNMEGREFEKFCYYLFKKTGKYSDVTLTQEKYDGGKDLILTTKDGEVIYVEAKRYTDRATRTEDFMIGREIVTKLSGTMDMNGVKHGIIMTTGNIHKNGWEAINGIEFHNPGKKIEVYNMDDIAHMVRECCDSNIFSDLTTMRI